MREDLSVALRQGKRFHWKLFIFSGLSRRQMLCFSREDPQTSQGQPKARLRIKAIHDYWRGCCTYQRGAGRLSLFLHCA
jgi:hypothetical protein